MKRCISFSFYDRTAYNRVRDNCEHKNSCLRLLDGFTVVWSKVEKQMQYEG